MARITFTEQGLADALADVIEALEGDAEGTVRDRANEIAATIFGGAYLAKHQGSS